MRTDYYTTIISLQADIDSYSSIYINTGCKLAYAQYSSLIAQLIAVKLRILAHERDAGFDN